MHPVAVQSPARSTPFDRHITALDEARFAEALAERARERRLRAVANYAQSEECRRLACSPHPLASVNAKEHQGITVISSIGSNATYPLCQLRLSTLHRVRL